MMISSTVSHIIFYHLTLQVWFMIMTVHLMKTNELKLKPS